jgi:molecular chaperone DnaK (HSP70)
LNPEPILGIDLGTTNSLVGVVDSGFPILLADENGDRSTPSAVSYGKEIIVGAAALRQRALNPLRTVTSVKWLAAALRPEIARCDAGGGFGGNPQKAQKHRGACFGAKSQSCGHHGAGVLQ